MKVSSISCIWFRAVLITTLLIAEPVWALTGTASEGQSKTEVCVACHGESGHSVVPNWPKLAGQHRAYLVKQMKDFKQGETGPRHDPSMLGMVINLTDQDIADIAAYYEEQTATIGKAKADQVALGEKIYRGGNPSTGVPACQACHGPSGLGNAPANYPRLSGQHADYIDLQLQAFKEGRRRNDPSGMMGEIARRMTEAEIKAVSSYVEGLH